MAYFVLCVKEQSVTLVAQYFVTAVNLAHQNRCSGVNIPQFELLSYDSEPWFCPKCINTSLPFSTEENVSSVENGRDVLMPVSYTHLTLPTILLV